MPLRKTVDVDTKCEQASRHIRIRNLMAQSLQKHFWKKCQPFCINNLFIYQLQSIKLFQEVFPEPCRHIVVCIVTWDFLGKFENPMSTRQELLHLTLPHVQIGGVCFQQRDVRCLQRKINSKKHKLGLLLGHVRPSATVRGIGADEFSPMQVWINNGENEIF